MLEKFIKYGYYPALIIGGAVLLWVLWLVFTVSCVLGGYPVEVCGL